MLNEKKVLHLSEIFGDSVSTRDAARKIQEILIKETIQAIDFNNVQFVSRSFAHELFLQMETLDDEISLLNQNPEIMKTFALVQKSRKNKGHKKTFDRVEITDPSFVF